MPALESSLALDAVYDKVDLVAGEPAAGSPRPKTLG
jgi:hypothetical protein